MEQYEQYGNSLIGMDVKTRRNTHVRKNQFKPRYSRWLKEVGEIIGVRLLDHIIIGDSYVSFVERGLL